MYIWSGCGNGSDGSADADGGASGIGNGGGGIAGAGGGTSWIGEGGGGDLHVDPGRAARRHRLPVVEGQKLVRGRHKLTEGPGWQVAHAT